MFPQQKKMVIEIIIVAIFAFIMGIIVGVKWNNIDISMGNLRDKIIIGSKEINNFKNIDKNGCKMLNTGITMDLKTAQRIARRSECAKYGKILNSYNCMEKEGMFMLNMKIDKEQCGAQCYVNMVNNTAKIEWRCMGLIPEPLPEYMKIN